MRSQDRFGEFVLRYNPDLSLREPPPFDKGGSGSCVHGKASAKTYCPIPSSVTFGDSFPPGGSTAAVRRKENGLPRRFAPRNDITGTLSVHGEASAKTNCNAGMTSHAPTCLYSAFLPQKVLPKCKMYVKFPGNILTTCPLHVRIRSVQTSVTSDTTCLL